MTVCKSYDCHRPVEKHTFDGFCDVCYEQYYERKRIEGQHRMVAAKHILSKIHEKNQRAWCAHCNGYVKIQYKRYRELGDNSSGYICSKLSKLNDKIWKKLRYYGEKTLMTRWCQACGATENLRYDHDYDTGLFRGTLCNKCNIGAGYFEDTPKITQAITSYLRGEFFAQENQRCIRESTTRKEVQYMINYGEAYPDGVRNDSLFVWKWEWSKKKPNPS